MTALEYFRLWAPEYASMPDADVEQWLAMAEMLINTGCLDAERAALATALYAAHLIKSQEMAQASGGGVVSGPIVSEKEGDLSRSYGWSGSQKSSNPLELTWYGQQYLQVTDACFGSAILTRIGDPNGNAG